MPSRIHFELALFTLTSLGALVSCGGTTTPIPEGGTTAVASGPRPDASAAPSAATASPPQDLSKCNETVCQVTAITDEVLEKLEQVKDRHRMKVRFITGTTDETLKTVSRIPWVEQLDVVSESVTNLDPVYALPSLLELEIGFQKTEPAISSLAGIEKLTGLVQLRIKLSRLRDIGPLAGLVKMRTLLLDAPSVEDVSPLRSMTALTMLSLKGMNAQGFESLSTLTELRSLALGWTQTKDLSAFTNSTKLESIDTWECPERLTGIEHMPKLKRLNMLSSHVSDLGPVQTLTSLTFINLQNSPVTDLSPLEAIAKTLGTIHLPKSMPLSAGDRLLKLNPQLRISHGDGSP